MDIQDLDNITQTSKDGWIFSEPPKDRWIIRWMEFFDLPVVTKFLEENERDGEIWIMASEAYYNEATLFGFHLLKNVWKEIPQKPKI